MLSTRCSAYLRPFGERWSIFLMEEVEQLVLLV